MSEEFEVLATKALSGDITPEEREHFEALLRSDPAFQKEFSALKIAWDSIADLEPLGRVLESPPVPIPDRHLARLLDKVARDTLARSEGEGKRDHSPSQVLRTEQDFGTPKGRQFIPTRPGFAFRWPRPWECVGVAVVVVLIFVFVGFFRPGGRIPAEGRLAQARFPVAYLVGVQGSPMVESSTGLLFAIVGQPLRAGESIRLAHGDRVRMVGPQGSRQLVGPTDSSSAPVQVSADSVGRGQKDFPGLPPPSDAVHALFAAVGDLSGEVLLRATRGPASIRLYSPIGATASDRPLVLWKAEEGAVYDIQITDELDSEVPAWRLAKVVPPLEFASVDAWRDRPLRRDHLYRIRLTESGRPLTSVEHTFRTTKDGQKVGVVGDMPLEEAYGLLTQDSGRTGDALALLLTLPPQQAETELALRLKLAAFGRLGYAEDFNAVLGLLIDSGGRVNSK